MSKGFEEITAALSEIKLFQSFPQKTLEKIAEKLSKKTYPKGTILFRAGDPADKLYLIVSGQVALLAGQNSDTMVARLGDGEILGEMAILIGEPRHITARLDTTSTLLELAKQDFEDLMQRDPTLAVHISRVLSRRLALTTAHSVNFSRGQTAASSRLYFFLNLLDELHESIFVWNLGVSLLEQTRRKVALVEFCAESGSSLLKFWGSVIYHPPQARDLKNLPVREMIEKLKIRHPCGLELITAPAGLAGALAGSEKLIAFLNYLRDDYDYILLVASPLSWENIRSAIEEADFIYILSLIDDPNREVFVSRLTQQWDGRPLQAASVREISLVPDGKDCFVARHKIRIGWAKSIERSYEERRDVFEALSDTRTQRAVDRFARILGNLKIGLALGAGGALGLSIGGVLQALNRERIYPDIVAGTSIGAIVGAMCAMGITVEEMVKIGCRFQKDWKNILLWDLTMPKGGGFLAGIKLMRFLRGIFDDRSFEDLEIPLSCVAADIMTGEEVILSSGRVLDAIRASISIPVIFKPYRYQNRYLVDGGVVNPVPTSVLVQMGADILISVNLTSPPAERKFSMSLFGRRETGNTEEPGIVDIFFRTMLTAMYQIALRHKELSHVTIHPQTPQFHWTDFDKMEELMLLGEQAAQQALPKIKTLLPFYANYCATRLK